MRYLAIVLVIACGTSSKPSAQKFGQAPGSGAQATLDAGCPQPIDAAPVNPPRVYPKTALDGNPQTDIESAPCGTGAVCATSVTLPIGAALVGGVIVDSPQSFQNVVWSTMTTADGSGVSLTVTGINVSQSATRLTALLEYTSQ